MDTITKWTIAGVVITVVGVVVSFISGVTTVANPEVRRFLHLEETPPVVDRKALEAELDRNEAWIESLDKNIRSVTAYIAGQEERLAQIDREVADLKALGDIVPGHPEAPAQMREYQSDQISLRGGLGEQKAFILSERDRLKSLRQRNNEIRRELDGLGAPSK